MPLYLSARDVPKRNHSPVTGVGAKDVIRVFGNECNISPNWHHPGYQSRPHYHDCEQLIYMIENDMWVFMDNEAYHLQAGDFLRIPPNAIHWAWNNFDKTSYMIEVHAPPLIGGFAAQKAVGLFAEGEAARPPRIAENLFNVNHDPSVAEAKAVR